MTSPPVLHFWEIASPSDIALLAVTVYFQTGKIPRLQIVPAKSGPSGDGRLQRRLGRGTESAPESGGAEGAFLARKPDFLHVALDPRGEFRQRRRRHDAGPEHARPLRLGEKSESFHFHGERFERADSRERFHHLLGLRVGDFAEKFEGKMNALRARPARVAAGDAETLLRFASVA